MSFDKLKLIAAPKKIDLDDAGRRRRRMHGQIQKQIAIVEKHRAGQRTRGRWWSDTPEGMALSIMFGRKPLELAKGRHAIACESHDDMLAALGAAKKALADGAFDTQLEELSRLARLRFKRTRGAA